MSRRFRGRSFASRQRRDARRARLLNPETKRPWKHADLDSLRIYGVRAVVAMTGAPR